MKGYDYSLAGAYFITIVTHDRKHILGEITNGEMSINKYGDISKFTWCDLVNHNPGIELDEFIIMPNHLHGIIIIHERSDFSLTNSYVETCPGNRNGTNVGVGSEPTPTPAIPDHSLHDKFGTSKTSPQLPEIIRQFKTFSTARINVIRNTPGIHFWQRNYYEHIIRDDDDLNRIRYYIINNPGQWDNDAENK